MPSIERDESRDSERRLKHQQSASSDSSRAIVPMWDSSDPERAPPPLPMNPSSPSVNTSRPNTSTAIQSAHAALTEKARENAYITNVSKRIDPSPERSLIKSAAHKRMQSLQSGSVRDLSNLLENGSQFGSPRSPEKRERRSSTPHMKDLVTTNSKSPEKDSSRSSTPTPTGRESPDKDNLTVRPSLRRPPQSILGENTPPQSATMLALQNMPSRDVEMPLSNITNGSNALVRTPQTFDAISNQILSLTSICTSLQREMAQLSRRSKDNATDLISLKEATNTRDEDIRKSLRELVTNLTEHSSLQYGGSGLLIDNKAHNSPSSGTAKSVFLPRFPSPSSFAASLDRESVSSPSLYNPDSAAGIALLEKILREMGTKEGQDHLVSSLSEVASQLSKDGISTAKKVDGLIQYTKENNNSQALVTHNGGGSGNTRSRKFSFEDPPRLELDFEPRSGPVTHSMLSEKENRNAAGTRGADIINDDIMKIIRTVKDSVAHGGGLTAEVKALVQHLRGEVLGMGRDIGRKLEKSKREEPAKDPSAEKEHMVHVVQAGLEELRHHMDRVIRENRRQSSSSTVSRVDYQEIYNAVRAAVDEQSSSSKQPELAKEDIIEAVKEAWEDYKPEIEVEHFGLERDELLATLKEGIQEFAPQERDQIGATRDEVFAAVVEGLKHFSPPRVDTDASLSREEILDAVRECLEEFEFPSAPVPEPRELDFTRDDMLDAVKEGLSTFDFAANTREDMLDAVKEGLSNFDFAGNTTAISRDVGGSVSREDLFDAVRAGLESMPLPTESFGVQVSERLQEILETMRTEFQAVSIEAKQNVSANGRDTEQVLDATKDGFEKLRADIETYVDRAADVTGKDEILESMRESFDILRAEVGALERKEERNDSGVSLEVIQGEFEHLRETMATSVVHGGSSFDKEEFLEALKDGLEGLRADIHQPKGGNESILSGTSEILDALQDGLTSLRVDVEKIGNKPVDMTVNYEILETLKAGLEGVRADIDRLHESNINERAIAPIEGGAVVTVEGLKRNDIENLEVLITQLRIKVEALESMPPPPPPPQAVPGSVTREDLAGIEEVLHNVQESVAETSARGHAPNEDGVKREDVEAIETLLRNTKAKLDDMDPEQAVKKDHLDSVESIVYETRENLNGLATHMEDVTKRDELASVELLIRDVLTGLEEMKERAINDAEDVEKVTKTDVQAVEAVCLDLKTSIETTLMSDVADLASKGDVKNLGELVKEFKVRIETHADKNAKAFEERQAETVGVGERVTEVKTFLEEFKDAIKEKLDDGATGVESLGKLLETVGENIDNNAKNNDLKELFETMKAEFEKSNAGVVGSKIEADEKFQQTWDKFDGKIEEKFNELMTKYDDAELAAEAKAKAGEEKMAESEEALLGTKAVAEDLKLLIDSLGTTLTDSVEKMDEASKTVFNRVEDTFARIEETHADTKSEHQLTREQVFKTLGAIEGVQAHTTEYSPKILESIKDVLLIVGQHYEHSKTSTVNLQEKIAERPAPPDTPLLAEPPQVEKYDDSPVHEKLDKLVDHMHAAGKSFAQLDTLERIHQQVIETAAEVSQFVSAQTQRIADDHEEKEKVAEEKKNAAQAATIALEKRIAQREVVELTVVGLREEEERLKASVAALKAEQDDLAHQKMRLTADVSSFETALRIRREEIQAMESRAEGLERRILEGVIDHSRALLLSKSKKSRDAMSRKRIPSHATSTTGSVMSNATSRASYTTQSAVSMAMSGNRALVNVPVNPNSSGASRRILSLNQITHNVPTGGTFKRSHSVKAPSSGGASGALRKTSWGGSLSQKYGELNKENLALMEESEEKDRSEDDDEGTENGDTRRVSRGTTVMTGTGNTLSESIDEGTEWTESVDGDEQSEVDGGDAAAVILRT